MTQTTDTINFQDKANFIWQVADDILFGPFMHNEFRDVVLPFVVLRRLDCIYTDEIRERVQKSYRQFKDVFPSEDDVEPILLDTTGGLKFYNISDFNLVRLAGNAQAIEENFDFYLKSYSRNVRDILQNFKLEGVIAKLIKNNLLYQLVSKFTEIDLHPSVVKNHEMGYIYEHLLYKFNQFTGETAGHHYTPREVIRLMCNLLFAEHGADLQGKGIVRDIFDPACGSGGMLTIAKEHILKHINPNAEIRLFGQELNEQTYAVSKSDFLVTGEEPSRIREGDSFTNDQFKTERFRYMLCNPPFGVNWKSAQAFIEEEAKNPHGRFFAGTPRVNDGALLFLQHMISKMEAAGSRIAIVFNGSPLFTGEAGGGESNIRKWIIENDMLEAIVALPDQMFYNTGINTYIWIVTNRKPKHRKGRVQLINGVKHFQKMRKSLGDKRNELSPQHIRELTELYTGFEEGKEVKIFDNEDFGYARITVERPLRLNFQLSEERLAQLEEESAWRGLATSKKKDPDKAREEEEQGKREQERYRSVLKRLDETKLYKDRKLFLSDLQKAAKAEDVKFPAPIQKAIVNALGERDETAEICHDGKGNPEPDGELRDYENVPLKEEIEDYMQREVLPHVPDAWVDRSKTKIGYEIPFTRHFYEYVPPRPLEKIEQEIRELEDEIRGMLDAVL
jgi:type I restriction enzyme M protein